MTCRRSLLGSPIYFLALVSTWRTLSEGIRCLFVAFDASLDSEGIRKRERLRIFRTSDVKLLAVVGSCENGGRHVLRTRQVRARGKSRRRRKRRRRGRRRRAAVNGSSGPGEVVVAVAVRTPPLMALQRSTTRATPLERSFRFILIFAGDAQAHRQLLRIPRGCESIIPLVCRKASAFGG